MKKVGVCTLHDAAPNFGATLQAFAMQEVLKNLGYEPEFLKFKLKDNREVVLEVLRNEKIGITALPAETLSDLLQIPERTVEAFRRGSQAAAPLRERL